jgi:hypothetical protein
VRVVVGLLAVKIMNTKIFFELKQITRKIAILQKKKGNRFFPKCRENLFPINCVADVKI